MAILALGLFTMAARNVTDPDVWWHLRTGQLIVQTRAVFHTDPYSFTRFGQPWVDHEWLSQILIFGLYRLAGWGGLIVGFGAVIAAAFFVVFLRCPGRPYVAGVITLLGAFASAPSWGVRPQMLTLLLASVLLLILERSYERPKLLWWTPALMLLWVNLHAGYAVGIALMALFLVGDGLDVAFEFKDGPLPSLALSNPGFSHCGLRGSRPAKPVWSGDVLHIRWKRSVREPCRATSASGFRPTFTNPGTCRRWHDPRDRGMAALSPRRLRPREDSVVIRDDVRGIAFGKAYTDLCADRDPDSECDGAAMVAGTQGREGIGSRSRRQYTPAKTSLNAALLTGFLIFLVARVRYVASRQAEAEAKELPAAASFLYCRTTGLLLRY